MVESKLVELVVAGSSPVGHPTSSLRMKNVFLYSIVSLASVALVQSSSLRAGEITPILSRYAFKPGQTNAYKLEIESQGETGREAATAACRSIQERADK